MSASNSDLLLRVSPNTGWQVSGAGVADSSVTTIPLVSATGLPTDTAIIITIDRVDSSGAKTPSKMERVLGVVSGNNIIDCVRGFEGTAQAHSGGAVVEIVISAGYENKKVTHLLTGHNQNGTHILDIDGTLAANSDTKIPSQKAVKTYTDRAVIPTLNAAPLYAPRGFMLNGKLEVTDAAGITVALKTLAGTDPTAGNPVYIRIGDTVRTISAALSIALADGISWFNAGSAELATKEIDYFVYAVWDSNSSAVALSFARIPYANLVSEFSATTTNEKYCAGYAGFTTTDEVENIGRFAATLSAGAGYTWTVPTFTASNLIQRPIFETRWLNWTPIISVAGGTAPTYTANFLNKYSIAGEKLSFNCTWDNTSGGVAGAGSGTFLATHPFNDNHYVATRSMLGSGHYFNTSSGGYAIAIGSSSNTAIQLFLETGNSLTGAMQSGTTRWINIRGQYAI